MLLESRQSVPYEKLLQDVVGKVKKLGYSDIRAELADHETPHQIVGVSSNLDFTPDVTAVKDDNKTYFEIAQKIPQTRELVNKWKMLETLAHMKNGNFQIFFPHGQMKFTQELLEAHKINAKLVKL
jgi:hypothetical protein